MVGERPAFKIVLFQLGLLGFAVAWFVEAFANVEVICTASEFKSVVTNLVHLGEKFFGKDVAELTGDNRNRSCHCSLSPDLW